MADEKPRTEWGSRQDGMGSTPLFVDLRKGMGSTPMPGAVSPFAAAGIQPTEGSHVSSTGSASAQVPPTSGSSEPPSKT